MNKKVELYFNTIRYLKSSQIFYRLYRKIVPTWKVHGCDTIKIPVHVMIREMDLDESYLKRFDCESLLNNEIFLLNEKHRVDFKDWTITGETTHLWIFNLHYMEYLIPMAARYSSTKEEVYYSKIKEILESWINRFEKADNNAWNPYTISLRFVNWLIVMELLGERLSVDYTFKIGLEQSLYRQYKYLKSNQEKHLLGNHYFENLKTLIIAGILFDDQKNLGRYLKCFNRQIQEQILEDGMHYERSFMYHNIIMEGVLRVLVVLKQAKGHDTYQEVCNITLGRMLNCMLSFEGRVRRIPLFNDAGNNVAKPVSALGRGVRKYLPAQVTVDNTIKVLSGAGYYRYELGNVMCIIDCGEIGPNYIPGHGQCDCLSYELYIDGVPFIVNSGTYQYQSSKRMYFRSTRAHNCFTINGEEQSQCWGEHRVAKRISDVRAVYGTEGFTGRCELWNGVRACRKMKFVKECVIVEDVCENMSDAVIQSYMHLAPDVEIIKLGERKYQLVHSKNKYKMYLEILSGKEVIVHSDDEICWYAEEFGRLEKKKVLELSGNTIIYKIYWGIK